MKVKLLPTLKSGSGGCAHCPSNEHKLPMRTRLYNSFGGYYITKNGNRYFAEDVNKEFDECKTLSYIERKAKQEPDNDWKCHLDLPLRDAVWQRQSKSKWLLVEAGGGFA